MEFMNHDSAVLRENQGRLYSPMGRTTIDYFACKYMNKTQSKLRGRRLPSLHHLRAFEAVARNGSVTLAAEELHVTQSAISHQVKALEAYLGVTLAETVAQKPEIAVFRDWLLTVCKGEAAQQETAVTPPVKRKRAVRT